MKKKQDVLLSSFENETLNEKQKLVVFGGQTCRDKPSKKVGAGGYWTYDSGGLISD
jgi:hypothetical protein